MVKITNFVNTFEVTQGAYDDIFKKQGFELVEEKEDKKETVEETKKTKPKVKAKIFFIR